MSLLELMIGLSIGVLAIGAAVASLSIAREASGVVTDVSQLQQQAAHALRVLGRQIRPASALDLKQAPDGERYQLADAPASPQGDAAIVRGANGVGAAQDTLDVARLAPALLPSQRRDCLGHVVAPGERMTASFRVDRGTLSCRNSALKAQPLVDGVAGFRVRYRVRRGDQVRVLHAGDVEAAGLWAAVMAVEVCLDLQGQEHARAYEGNYTTCQGQEVPTGGRLHLVTQQVFRLRSPSGDGA